MSRHVDVLVVGSGGSGAPLAARLSEDSSRRVLVLEAGPTPRSLDGFPPELLDAASVAGASPQHPDNWAYDALLAPGRAYSIAHGRILGGSTTINGAYFERARPEDFAAWSAGGNDAWTSESVLPLQRRLERDLDFGAAAAHGDSGPIPVQRTSLDHPAAAAFAAAAAELGAPAEPDKNDSTASGIGPVPCNAIDGVRWNTGMAYLLPAADRDNLEIRGGVKVTRVLIEGGRAVGVEALVGGQLQRVRADEVVLCAGAIGSPTMLLRSGIGPADEMRALNIEVVVDAPGVGAAFSDHPQLVLEWRPIRELPQPTDGWMGGGLNVEAGALGDGAELELLQSLVPMALLTATGSVAPGAPLPFLVSVQTPVSQGRIRLVSAALAEPPSIEYGYLSTDADRARLRRAARLTAEISRTRSFREVSAELIGLEPTVLNDDRALDGWVAGRLGTSIHACGSAPFGPAGDPGAVVDQFGRVFGLAGLRVADTSILPKAPRRGPAATAVLIGELVADAMRSGS